MSENVRYLSFEVTCPYYRAPEVYLYDNTYDYQIDVWGFGAIIGELFTNRVVFEEFRG